MANASGELPSLMSNFFNRQNTMVENQSAAKSQPVGYIARWLESENKTCSSIMEEKVTNLDVLSVMNLLVSLMLVIGTAETNLPLSVILSAWFITSAVKFTKGGTK